MMKKVLIIISILLYLFVSCAGVPKPMRNAFTNCYSDENTGLDTLININGYYEMMMTMKRSRTVGGFLRDTSDYYIDTAYRTFMFYYNGLFTDDVGDTNMDRLVYDSITKRMTGGNTPLSLQEIAENSKGEERKWFYRGSWGCYIVCSDTIKIQYIDEPVPLSKTNGREEWFKIIDRNTLIPINTMPLSTSKSDWQNYEHYKAEWEKSPKYPAVFQPAPVIPSPDEAWILKEKWFWCNEDDWKAYMYRIKEVKKKKKKKE